MNKIVPALLAALLLAACSSTPKTGSGAPARGSHPGGGFVVDRRLDPGHPDHHAGRALGSTLAILKDPKSILSKRSVYFDFDST